MKRTITCGVAVVLGVLVVPASASAQGAGGPAPGASARTPAASAASAPKTTAWAPKRLPDGQPDISGIWLAQGIGTEPKVGGPFDAASSAALIAGRLKEAVETGGTLSGVGRCSNVYWDPKPDLSIPKGVVDPPDGEVPLTPMGLKEKAAVKAFQQQKDRPTPDQFDHWVTAGDETCMPGTPYPMFNVLPYSANQFFQGPGYVLMVQEFSHISRYIPIDASSHLASGIRQWKGDSRGHWEGTTLVVDVTNFNGKSRYDGNPGAGIVQSDVAHVVERFKFVGDGMILYEATIEDPKISTRPWKMAGAFTRAEPDYRLWEYACWEGNRDVWLQFGIVPPIPPANPSPK